MCTDPSYPWRHCALSKEVWEKYDGVPSVCFIENDGCPDHNYRHLKPLLAMICLGLTAGVRVLVLNQNVAKQSFLNLVERVMSLINMSTSGAIATRARGSEKLEQLIKKSSGQTALRTFFKRDPELKNEIQAVLKPVETALNRMMSSAELKGKPFRILDHPEQTVIDKLKSKLEIIDPALTSEGFQFHQKNVKGLDKFKKFMDDTLVVYHDYLKIWVNPNFPTLQEMDETNELFPLMNEVLTKKVPIPQEVKTDGHYHSFEELIVHFPLCPRFLPWKYSKSLCSLTCHFCNKKFKK